MKAMDVEAWAGVRAIGLSGQMHGAVLMDGNGEVLRPAILWNDTRSAAQCEELVRRLPSLPLVAGNLAMPGFTAPKLLWLREHEPAVFDRVASVLLPKDWLRWRLSGERITDCSDASGTLWLDVGARRWSPELLAACGLSAAQMPSLVEGSAAAGRLRAEWAQRWSLRQGIVIAGGGGDNAASAVGIGAVRAGQGFVSLGTSGVIFVASDRFMPNPRSAVHAFCHALPARWHQMSVMLSAASALRWATRLTGAADEAALVAQAQALSPMQRASAPIFLPYLSGERTPHNDPYAQGVFFGMTHATDRALLGYSVLEGVTLALTDGLDALRSGGTEAHALSLLGGGARSAYWGQLLADALDTRTRTHGGGETGAALGAARLGWLAAGGDPASVLAKPAIKDEFVPNQERHELLRQRLKGFRELYQHVRPLFDPARPRLA